GQVVDGGLGGEVDAVEMVDASVGFVGGEQCLLNVCERHAVWTIGAGPAGVKSVADLRERRRPRRLCRKMPTRTSAFPGGGAFALNSSPPTEMRPSENEAEFWGFTRSAGFILVRLPLCQSCSGGGIGRHTRLRGVCRKA